MMEDLFEGMAGVVAAMLGVYLVVAFVLVYFAADAQGRRAGDRDPAVGARVVTNFLLTITFQAGLAGLALLLAALFDNGPGMMFKAAFGLIIGAGLASALPLAIQRARIPKLTGSATNRVGRKTVGINAILTGLASTASIMGLAVGVIMGTSANPSVIAVAIVYTAGALLTMRSVSESTPTLEQ